LSDPFGFDPRFQNVMWLVGTGKATNKTTKKKQHVTFTGGRTGASALTHPGAPVPANSLAQQGLPEIDKLQ
jgi:hypothetical protein